MNKPVIIYGSSTGNTETVAIWIKEALASSGIEADVFDVSAITPEDVERYSLIVLGSSTWGNGELQDDFVDFYNAMTHEHLEAKKVAVFGCGDNDMFPDFFCQAVDLIAEKAIMCGADIISRPLKIDGDIDLYKSDVDDWSKNLLS